MEAVRGRVDNGVLVVVEGGCGALVGLGGGAVDNLVGDADHRVEVADVGAHRLRQQLGRQREARGVVRHDLRGCAVAGGVVGIQIAAGHDA